ncbi:MAG: hypothetical protein SAJ37_01090 [Oscillatoria sp. PMC 1068.18]|nr:hypothetical protein [Oscillatoria sp. PMC 1076.18]MEC4987317.1 hypothetical protein [Oscillatoria sp. PMC 1068.18]
MTRVRKKLCNFCGEAAAVLYRIQYDESQQWQFVCHSCWENLSDNNPNYTYGGTWKAVKKK